MSSSPCSRAGHDVRVVDALLPSRARAGRRRACPTASRCSGRPARPATWPGARWPASTPSATRRRWSASASTCATSPTTPRTTTSATAVLLRALAQAGFAGRLVLAESMVVYGEGRYACPEHGDVRPGPARAATTSRPGASSRPARAAGGRWPRRPVPEDAPPDPRNVYAATKLHQEHLCRAGARARRRHRDGAALPQRLRAADAARHALRGRGRHLPQRARRPARRRASSRTAASCATSSTSATSRAPTSSRSPRTTRRRGPSTWPRARRGPWGTWPRALARPRAAPTRSSRASSAGATSATCSRAPTGRARSSASPPRVGLEEGMAEFALAPLR